MKERRFLRIEHIYIVLDSEVSKFWDYCILREYALREMKVLIEELQKIIESVID